MITPFNLSVIRRAIEVVDRSEADTTLLALLSPPGRGRRPNYNTRAFLVGSILSVQWKGSNVIRNIYRILTQQLPVDVQLELDVRSGTKTITEKDLYAITEAIEKYLAFGEGSAHDIEPNERQRRRDELLDLMHRMLALTLPESPSTTRAMDSTGIWSYGKATRRAPKDILKRDAALDSDDAGASNRPDDREALAVNECDESEEDDSPGPEQEPQSVIESDTLVRPPSDRDARWGVKTRKDGERETYFGYELHALVRAPDRKGQPDFIPLFESFEITPAGVDIVAPSLRVIDRALRNDAQITDLLTDRHYNYKAPDRWYFELLNRGIRQHVDLHPNDQGFRDYNGMKLAAGWMHCPATPDRLGRIDQPGPLASTRERKDFSDRIDERATYAMRRVARANSKTGARWQCPALDGRIGCPLRSGTVEVAQLNGLPVVVDAPKREEAPPCCTQTTASSGHDAQIKVEQQYYWGSREWRERYNARTYVEGAFGNMKNKTRGERRTRFLPGRRSGQGDVRSRYRTNSAQPSNASWQYRTVTSGRRRPTPSTRRPIEWVHVPQRGGN